MASLIMLSTGSASSGANGVESHSSTVMLRSTMRMAASWRERITG